MLSRQLAHHNLMVLHLYAVHRQDYWYANVSKSYCYDSSNIDTCTFYFSFCHPVPPEVNGKCYENGVCQIGERTGSSKQVYGMGLFTNMTRFIPSECHLVLINTACYNVQHPSAVLLPRLLSFAGCFYHHFVFTSSKAWKVGAWLTSQTCNFTALWGCSLL